MIDPYVSDFSPSDTFVIEGSHTNDRTNLQVWAAQIAYGNIPVIIREFFTTFPNLLDFKVRNSALETLASGDFENAVNVRRLELSGNRLTAIPADAFQGASSIGILNFYNNEIELIHADAFRGMDFCYDVTLSSNSLQLLEPKVLQALPYLRLLILNNNQITSLLSNLFQNNPLLNYFSAIENEIISVSPNIFDSIPQVSDVNLRENSCVDREWRSIGTVSTWEQVFEELDDCFSNYVGNNNGTKIFTLELTGTLIIRDENGQELMRLNA